MNLSMQQVRLFETHAGRNAVPTEVVMGKQ